MYALLFLNQVHPIWSNRGWAVSTIYEDFPTVEQILDHSCLLSEDKNDVKMAKMLVEDRGKPVRFIYPEQPRDKFFEVMIIKIEFGVNLNLWEYFTSGYADMNGRQIIYEPQEDDSKQGGL